MHKPIIIASLIATLVGVWPAPAADPAKEPLVEQVRKAIEDGKKFLRERQRVSGDVGNWEDGVEVQEVDGGFTSLALIALLTAGEKPTAPVIQRGLKYLRNVKVSHTYVVGLMTIVFAEAGQPEDKLLIQRNVDWLVEARVMDGGKLLGWNYTKGGRIPDNSNTQYALLGLYAGKQAGATVKREAWESVQEFFLRTQNADGGWGYRGGQRSTLTMGTAGLGGLLMASMELDKERRKLRPDGSDPECGKYPDTEAVAKATRMVADRFNIPNYTGYVYYNLYGLERAGRLSGQRFFGDHDWYREGCEYLTNTTSPIRQNDEGAWFVRGSQYDRWPVVSTSFALLFLSKGRTPVLISKLVHGAPDGQSQPWNNKHNDCRHLVEYASKEMFKKQPLGWQVFNDRQSAAGIEELTGELLQGPIAYLNGHGNLILTGKEEKILKLFVEQGGFLVVEACCGDKQFDASFRALMRKLFDEKDHPLKRLPDNHPVWTAHAKLIPSDDFPLEGMEFGCRTSIVYCPKAISGYWEINDSASPKGQYAFRLAGNVIAYATGMELPKPKLTKVEVAVGGSETKAPRGFFKVAQLKHANDRHSNTGVLRNLMAHLKQTARLDAALQTQELSAGDKDLLNYRFMYMHGRGDFDIDEVKLIRANIEAGGLLFADACCGKKPFDDAFRAFIKKVFPDKQLEPIPVDDELYSKELNGSAISTVRCRREGGEAGFKDVAPALEGIKVEGRWAVIYSKYDIGCALEKHASSDCLGHDHANALKLASAVVMYSLQR